MPAALHSGRHPSTSSGQAPAVPYGRRRARIRRGRPLCLPSTPAIDRAGLLRYDPPHVFFFAGVAKGPKILRRQVGSRFPASKFPSSKRSKPARRIPPSQRWRHWPRPSRFLPPGCTVPPGLSSCCWGIPTKKTPSIPTLILPIPSPNRFCAGVEPNGTCTYSSRPYCAMANPNSFVPPKSISEVCSSRRKRRRSPGRIDPPVTLNRRVTE